MGPLCKERANLLTQDMEKAELLGDFFASIFTGKCSSITAEVTGGKGTDLPHVGDEV